MEDPNDLMSAYTMASKAGDTDAMRDLESRILAAKQAPTQKFQNDPTSGMSTGEKLLAGVGHGMQRGNEGLANMVGLGPTMQKLADWSAKQPILKNFPLASSNFTDEKLKNEDEQAAPLMQTGGGKLGDIAGQVAAAAPAGMGTGTALRAAGMNAPGMLPLAVRAATAGGENAAQSASMADPEHQGSAALTGAALGGGLSTLGSAAGRVARGAVPKSEALQRMEADASAQGRDLFVPISQGAAPGLTKSTYQHVLPYALGVESRLGRQSETAKDTMREVLSEHGMPVQDTDSGLVRMKANIGETPEHTAANVKDQFDREYQDKLKAYTFNTPQDFHNRVIQNIKTEHPDLPDTQANQIASTLDQRMQEYSKNGQITGGNLLEASGAARKDLEGLVSSNRLRNPRANESGLQSFDDIVQDEIDANRSAAKGATGQNLTNATQTVRDLRNYQRLGDAYKEAKPVIDATEAAIPERGAYNFSTVAKKSSDDSTVRRMAQDAHDVLENENSGAVNPAGRHFLHQMGGFGLPATIMATGHPIGAAASIGIPNLMATQSAQKLLYGDTSIQQALARAIRNNPQTAYSTGMAARSAADASGQ